MVWCLVDNNTPRPVKVATYNAADFLLQTVPANQYTLAAGETRLVSGLHTTSKVLRKTLSLSCRAHYVAGD